MVSFFWLTDCMANDHFRDVVAPIFEQRCLSCHNDRDQKGDFSLQHFQAATADGYIEAGDSAASHLIELITPNDDQSEMPKDASPLSDDEIAAIRAWIDNGANWPADLVLQEPSVTDFDWWSYQPMTRPVVPNLNSDWVRNPIDAFVLDGLRAKGLTRSGQAVRRTLIRRVAFDLTGLPPTPKEVEAFVNDDDPEAYEKLVDRLLDSKSFGERWARHWLDVVKYADTCGYDKDKLRPNAWPYRDYVIRSFNEDKPYGQFVREQVAGDALYPGDPDGILGLGFIAAGPWDFIGHVEVSEKKIDGKVARNLDRDDMVSNTLNTFCSVTVQCARCHNHKFDPITQENYYGLQAIFAAVDRAERPYDLDEAIVKKRGELGDALASLKLELAELNAEFAKAGGQRLVELNQQIEDLQDRVTLKKEPEFGYHSQIASTADLEKWFEIQLGEAIVVSRVVLHPTHDEHAGIGAGFGFPVRFKVELENEDGQWRTIGEQTDNDFPNPGLAPYELNEINHAGTRLRVTATKLVERKNDFILAMAEVEIFDAEGKNVALGKEAKSLDSIESGQRWGRKNLTDGHWPIHKSPELVKRLEADKKERSELYARIADASREKRRKEIDQSISQTNKKLKELPTGKMVYAAAADFKPQANFLPTKGALRPINVLYRGEVLQPGDEAVPGALPLGGKRTWQFSTALTESERRVELAEWLTRDDHPLVWRSIVNRVWQYHFGKGIVATPNDFGRMGAEPTNPELLDWLALEFRDGGQTLKRLHRLIVTSNAYRQSSEFNEANAKIDQSNQFLWRMNRRRLEAEEIRDSILSVSGALNPKMGGPGFYLFKLERTTHSPHYEYHKFDPKDKASHRRSIYRFIVRSQPDPWMTTLDCADSSQSTPSRNETWTSLQALSLLNNRFNLEMASRFANRLREETAALSEQVDLAMLLTTQRSPADAEKTDLMSYAQEHGLENLCRFMFNLSEFVYLD